VTETAPAKNQIEEYSLPKLLVLHLLPAGAMLLFYIPLARIASENGIPTMFVLAVLFTLILVPFELGWLYYQGKKLNGTLSLQGVVCYREKMPWWQYLAFGLGTFAWVVLIFFSSTSLMDYLDTHLFAWIPDWFKLSRGSAQQHGPAIESTMWILGLIIIAIIGPLSEELYFRGYLLPRLTQLGKWAPLVNVSLFILYHFWQPQAFVTGIVAMLPLVYIVWWKRNVYLTIGLHIFINTFGWANDLAQRLASS
jgi:membrane protease YdiL (CAAX protease family)